MTGCGSDTVHVGDLCPSGWEATTGDQCPTGVAWCQRVSAELACRAPAFSPMECQAAGGRGFSDPGDGGLVLSDCPDGWKLLGLLPSAGDSLCCAPPPCPSGWETITDEAVEQCPASVVWCQRLAAQVICRAPTYSPEQCQAAGGMAFGDPGDAGLYLSDCPDGRRFLALLQSAGESLCCAACPHDWQPMPAGEGCPVGAGWCERVSAELSCEPPTYSIDECRAMGGAPVGGRPGAGTGCGDGTQLPIGLVLYQGQGGLCCRTTPLP
jgi:hypothetical protein